MFFLFRRGIGLWGMVAVLLGGPSFLGTASANQAETVILFAVEGVGRQAVEQGHMPVLSRMIEEGSSTWSASTVTPDLTLPAMTSMLTGLSVEQHGVTWNQYEMQRGYVRPPTVFDYLDLGAGKDSAVFFMDESLFQLARFEIYIDYQMCGPSRPECTASTVVEYIRDYFQKVTGAQHGNRLFRIPDLLLVHLPEPNRAARQRGWDSQAYVDALKTVDTAIGDILELYRAEGMLNRTMVIVAALNGSKEATGVNGKSPQKPEASEVLWLAWGANIKQGHTISKPVSIKDTGATILKALGVETYTEWDSRPIEGIFASPPKPFVKENALAEEY